MMKVMNERGNIPAVNEWNETGRALVGIEQYEPPVSGESQVNRQ